jgi:hypothetical protein
MLVASFNLGYAPKDVNPEPHCDSILIALGEEGAKQCLASRRGTEAFVQCRAGVARIDDRQRVRGHAPLPPPVGDRAARLDCTPCAIPTAMP